jgi:hypothetical protein
LPACHCHCQQQQQQQQQQRIANKPRHTIILKQLSPALGAYISGNPAPPVPQAAQQQQQPQAQPQFQTPNRQQQQQPPNWQYHQQNEGLPPRITAAENARRAAAQELNSDARKRLQQQFLEAYLAELKAQGTDLYPPTTEADAGPCETMRVAALECLKTTKREHVGTTCSEVLNGFRLCLKQNDKDE